MKFLDIYNQDKKLHKGIIKDLKLLFKNTDYILGSYVGNFEKKFAKYCNVKYVVGCANCTDAIYLALKSLNLKKNGQII